jgi:hypothetical protein
LPTDNLEQKIKHKRTALNQKWFKAVLFAYQLEPSGKDFHISKERSVFPSEICFRQLEESILKYKIIIEQNQVYFHITDTGCFMNLWRDQSPLKARLGKGEDDGGVAETLKCTDYS